MAKKENNRFGNAFWCVAVCYVLGIMIKAIRV